MLKQDKEVRDLRKKKNTQTPETEATSLKIKQDDKDMVNWKKRDKIISPSSSRTGMGGGCSKRNGGDEIRQV